MWMVPKLMILKQRLLRDQQGLNRCFAVNHKISSLFALLILLLRMLPADRVVVLYLQILVFLLVCLLEFHVTPGNLIHLLQAFENILTFKSLSDLLPSSGLIKCYSLNSSSKIQGLLKNSFSRHCEGCKAAWCNPNTVIASAKHEAIPLTLLQPWDRHASLAASAFIDEIATSLTPFVPRKDTFDGLFQQAVSKGYRCYRAK